MKKSILFSSAMLLAVMMSCDVEEVVPGGGEPGGPEQPIDEVASDLLSVGFYNAPQNLSDARSNPERLSLDSPEEFFEIEFEASANNKVNFVSMSSISNDWLFAPVGGGVSLFDDQGNPDLRNITDQVYLWDAGTEEENSLTFGGGNPELREEDDDNTVRVLATDVSEYIRAELTNYDDATSTFTLRIYNLRGEFADPDPIRVSPGVVVVQPEDGQDPFFTAGASQRGNGLQLLAERGDFSELLASLTE